MSFSHTSFKMVPMLIVMGTIFFLSHQTNLNTGMSYFPGYDKFCHALIYGVLAASVLYGIPEKWKQNRLIPAMLVTVSVCIVYGASDELHQTLIPGRNPDLADLAADAFGAILVVLSWNFISLQKKIRRDSLPHDNSA